MTPQDAHNAGMEKAAKIAELAAETCRENGRDFGAKVASEIAALIRENKLST